MKRIALLHLEHRFFIDKFFRTPKLDSYRGMSMVFIRGFSSI